MKTEASLPTKARVLFDMSDKTRAPGKGRVISGAGIALSSMLVRERIPFSFRDALVTDGDLRITSIEDNIIAISVYDDYFRAVQNNIKEYRKQLPGSFIVLGGPRVTASNLEKLAGFFPEANFFVPGDGELIFLKIVEMIGNRKLTDPLDNEFITKIKDLKVYFQKDGKKIFFNPGMNLLTPADFHQMTYDYAYKDFYEQVEEEGFLALHTSRGCKYRCLFCSHQYRKEPVNWSADRIIEELRHIKTLIEKKSLPQSAKCINFSDDDFIQDRSRAIRFFNLLNQDIQLKIFWEDIVIQASVPSFFKEGELDMELINSAADAGIKKIKIGVDAYQKEAIKFLKNGRYDKERIMLLASALRSKNISQEHYLILTYPGITQKILKETLEFLSPLIAMNIAVITNLQLTVLEAAPLYNLLRNQGYKFSNTVTDKMGNQCVLPEALSSGDQQIDLLLKKIGQKFFSLSSLLEGFQAGLKEAYTPAKFGMMNYISEFNGIAPFIASDAVLSLEDFLNSKLSLFAAFAVNCVLGAIRISEKTPLNLADALERIYANPSKWFIFFKFDLEKFYALLDENINSF